MKAVVIATTTITAITMAARTSPKKYETDARVSSSAFNGLRARLHPLSVAKQVAVNLFRSQILDHAGELAREMQDFAVCVAHGGKAMVLPENPGKPRDVRKYAL